MAKEETEEKVKLEPKSEIENTGPCKIRIKIEIGTDKINERVESKFEEINKTMAVPGFRPGHVPRSLLDRKYGKKILETLKLELLEESYGEVIKEKDLTPVRPPDLSHLENVTVKANEPFAYTVDIETKPKLDIKNYTGITVKKKKIEITPEEEANFIKNLAESKAGWEPAADKTAAIDDQIICDLNLSIDGKPSLFEENTTLYLTENIAFRNIPMPDFYKSVLGKKVDDRVEYTTTIGTDAADKTIAGKKLSFDINIKSVKRKNIPPIDDSLAKSLGVGSLDELRQEAKKAVQEVKEKQIKDSMIEQIMQRLLKDNDFELPEGLINDSKDDALNRRRMSLLYQGISQEEIDKIMENEKQSVHDSAIEHLKTLFILENIANNEKVYATEDEVGRKIDELAARQGRWPHEVSQYIEDNDLMPVFRRKLREDMTLEFLVENAVVEEE